MIKQVTGFLACLLVGGGAYAEDSPKLPKTMMSGAQVFQAACVHCHGAGLVGAPRAGDKAIWKSLIEEGFEDIVGSAITGVRRMPPLGGEPGLHDIEVARGVVYMVEMAGGKFPEPTDANVKAARADGEKRVKERIAKARGARK